MDRYETPHYRTNRAQASQPFDTILSYGPCAGAMIAANERQDKARQRAALWSATHPGSARRPGAWRCWVGTFLVRAGTSLQGVPRLAAGATPAAG